MFLFFKICCEIGVLRTMTDNDFLSQFFTVQNRIDESRAYNKIGLSMKAPTKKPVQWGIIGRNDIFLSNFAITDMFREEPWNSSPRRVDVLFCDVTFNLFNYLLCVIYWMIVLSLDTTITKTEERPLWCCLFCFVILTVKNKIIVLYLQNMSLFYSSNVHGTQWLIKHSYKLFLFEIYYRLTSRISRTL